MRSHHNRILDKLLHTIHDPIPIPAWLHPTPSFHLVILRRELRVRLRHGGLVRDDEHAHPAAEDAQGVDGVEGLGAAGDFGDGEGAALCWADGADGEGDPVDLVFEDCCLDYCYYCARCQYIYI